MARKRKVLTPKEADARSRREIYEWIQCFTAALIICVLTFAFFVRIINVSGTSMNPTLQNGDKMLVSDLLYKPHNGDIVVFKSDTYDPNKALVKRVIATEGQVVNIDFDNGIVYVNGEALDEPYIAEPTTNKLNFIGPQTVPAGCVFVLGDNRNASTDSRDNRIGMMDARLIIGRVYAVIYPLNNLGFVK